MGVNIRCIENIFDKGELEMANARWLNQEPQVATEEDCKGKWSGLPDGEGFRCKMCGYRFKVGDYWRWVSGEGKTINFIVCKDCDGEDVKERFVEHVEKGKREFWWMIPDCTRCERY